MIKSLHILAIAAFMAVFSPFAQAQESVPEVPKPIQNLVNEGAQIRYLGDDYGAQAWLTIKNGQEQYFYVLPGGEAFLMGVLFNNKGEVVTVDQVRKLRAKGDTLLDTLAENAPQETVAETSDAYNFKSPSEQLFYDVSNSNWVPLGVAGAPVAYAFIDPLCPHCHEFIKDVRKDIEAGKLQLRLIPVGFKDETRAQAAFLMATPNAQERWFKHMDGDKEALPAKTGINEQGVQRNLAIMQSWEFSATPMVIYRGKDETVKIIRGRPQDPKALISDIGART